MIIINLIFFVILCATALWVCFANVSGFKIVDAVTVVGTIGSIHGIGLTIWQLTKVKSATEQVAAGVKVKLESLNDLITMADVSSCEETIRSIHSYLERKEYLAASLRMSDVMKILKECVAIGILSVDNVKVVNSMNYLSLDIEALNSPSTLDVRKVKSHMNKLEELLMETSSGIKAKNYGKEI